jgi:hypothetical protein
LTCFLATLLSSLLVSGSVSALIDGLDETAEDI